MTRFGPFGKLKTSPEISRLSVMMYIRLGKNAHLIYRREVLDVL
ncbi:hypothetical protein [Frigidibacter sp. ROC022]|nr:hypothetical protein [Frigidibacter sp. ROC022]MCR8722779.1 hypothetical protein [Frigidibacter sp. ROC022]